METKEDNGCKHEWRLTTDPMGTPVLFYCVHCRKLEKLMFSEEANQE